jgi:hypothetical protein
LAERSDSLLHQLRRPVEVEPGPTGKERIISSEANISMFHSLMGFGACWRDFLLPNARGLTA